MPKTASALALILVLWMSYWYLLRLSVTYLPESDTASPWLAAQDILRGNLLLRGWSFSTDSYWLTDIPLYAMGLAIRGFTPSLLHEMPTVVYVGLLILVILAVRSPFMPGIIARSKWTGVTAALSPLLFPSDTLGTFVLRGPYHIVTTGFVLGSFLLIHHGGKRPIVAATALLAAAMASDPYALWIGIVPAILVSGVLLARNPRTDGSALLPVGVAIVGWAAAKITLVMLGVIGGFSRVTGERAAFVDMSNLGANASWFARDVLNLFGANFFGQPVALSTVPVLFRLAGCLAVLASIWVTLRHIRQQEDRLSLLLTMSSVVITMAFIFSAASRSTTVSTGTRFVVPLVILGSALFGRIVSRLPVPTISSLAIAMSAVVVMGLYAVAPLARLRQPAPFVGAFITGANDWSSMNALGAWLAAHGLRTGYGPYSAASVVTVATKGAIIIRPVSADHPWAPPQDDIRPLEWNSKCTWYHDPSARFVVARENWDNINLKTAASTFGTPTAISTVAGFTIFEWDRPITFRFEVRTSRVKQRIVQRFPIVRQLIDSPCG